MDEFLRDIYGNVFKEWILTQTSSKYNIFVSQKDENVIVIETDYSHSEVTFNSMNIIELSVTNLIHQNIEFYLHFQLKTLNHAIELFREMIEVVLKLADKPIIKVLLSCSGGLTTTFFMEKLNEATQLLMLNYEFHAVAYSELFHIGEDYDVIMLAPQISYMQAKVQDILRDKIVLKIPPQYFAKYDVAQTLTLIQEQVDQHQKEETISDKPLHLMIEKEYHYKTLCIAIIRLSERVYLDYRLYDENNHIVMDKEIIKNRISLDDICDILDTVFLTHNDVEIVGISMPGIINDGRLSLLAHGFCDCDIIGVLSQKYSQKFVLSNDVNCIAVGYYASQDQYSSISFLFQPKAGYPGGVGNIFQGQLIKGRQNIAGEVQYLPLHLSQDFLELTKTPDGSLELVAKTLVSVISIFGPEVIVLSCQLICDLDKLKLEMEKYIPKQYIPEMIKIENLKEYILFGQMIICNQESHV